MASSTLCRNMDELKEMYHKRMQAYFSKEFRNNPLTLNGGSRLWVANMIDRIKKAKINVPDPSLTVNNYDVMYKDGNEVLIKKYKKCIDRDYLPIIPWEDSFHIIWQAHIDSSHGDMNKTMSILKKKCYINTTCVKTLLELCHICIDGKALNKETLHTLSYKAEGAMQILDMTSTPDKDFRYILIYEDVATGFTQLRGLTHNTDMEIAMELFKIFMDLGPPKTLLVNQVGEHKKVIQMIKEIYTPCTITLQEGFMFQSKSKQVEVMINNWMKVNNDNNWVIGCHMVQWTINNIKSSNGTPYQLVFGSTSDKLSNQYVQENVPSQSVAESLQTEEDLGIFKDIKSEDEDCGSISDSTSPGSEDTDIKEILQVFDTDSEQSVSGNFDDDVAGNTSHNKQNIRVSVDSEFKEGIDPLDFVNIGGNENSTTSNDCNLAISHVPDIKEEEIEAPSNENIYFQDSVDPLATIKYEEDPADSKSDTMQVENSIILNKNVNIHNLNLLQDTKNSSSSNERNVKEPEESAIFSDDSGILNGDNAHNVEQNCAKAIEFEEELIEFSYSSNEFDNKHNTNTEDDMPVCKECKAKISTKVYTCRRCENGVHLYCSERVAGAASAISQVICNSCLRVEHRIKELKRKAEQCEQLLRETCKKK